MKSQKKKPQMKRQEKIQEKRMKEWNGDKQFIIHSRQNTSYKDAQWI